MNGGTMGDASEYFKSLISEGYTSDEALNYTVQHFPEFKLELHDSVIAGDVITTQSITSADADVVRAAMEGVVDAIRELQPKESKEVSEPKLAPLPPLPPVLTVHDKVDLAPKSNKKIVISASIVGLLLLTTILAVLFLVGDAESHPIVDRWYEEGPPDQTYIQFDADGTFFVMDQDDIEEEGKWEINGDVLTLVFPLEDDVDGVQYHTFNAYFHISEKLLVLHEVGIGYGYCEPWIRNGYQQSEASMQAQADLATPPSFCELTRVDW